MTAPAAAPPPTLATSPAFVFRSPELAVERGRGTLQQHTSGPRSRPAVGVNVNFPVLSLLFSDS